MTVDYSNCIYTWEKVAFWIPVVDFFIITISSVVLFNMEKVPNWKESKKDTIIFELLGPLHVIFSDRYLKTGAKVWRWIFVGSVSVLVIHILAVASFSICSPST